MTISQGLTAEKLRFTCDENVFDFDTTETVPPLEVMIGQERAVKAVEFGLFTKNPGYNIFISGLVGTGKITYAETAVKKVAGNQEVPNDWCYVNNLETPGQPIALALPAGMGYSFKQDMQELVENLKTDIPKVFSSEDYEQAKSELVKQYQEQRSVMVEEFTQYAETQGISPQWSSTGFVGLPMVDGKAVGPEDYQKLDKQQRDIIEKNMLAVHEKGMDVVRRVQLLERSVREQLKQLDIKIGLFAAGHLIEEFKEKYRDYQPVVDFLEAIKQDVSKNINEFKPQAEEENNPLMLFKRPAQDAKDKYNVNLLVDNRETQGAPVIVEINPTYYNLVGRAEYETRMGVVSTDFTMIKPGALHRANGGYLILNARDVLTNIGAWEALKRVLKTKKLQIENLGEQYGVLAMASLKPEPIPINVKVILIGNPYIYQLLYNYDEDFRKLFKAHADFDVVMENNPVNIQKLAGFISSTVSREKLKHFDKAAVARVVEYSSRLTGTQTKLTTRFNEVVELLCEADVWATLDNSQVVTTGHIKKAIEEKRYRANKYEERLQEMFAEGQLLIDTEGEKVGQVNGLAVLSVGEYMFGKPSRITANTYLGKSGVVNIERETKTSGTSHTKGVLILSGYLGQKYAQKHPLTLTASLTFEQLYDGVDGDSASSTELYAILSSLSGLPIKQYIAITGSVNQKGEVQPIGGATEKIEGFFAVCKLKGLTGKQGVMIPHQNVSNLALSDEVIEAVRRGKFHIYPVKTIDQGIEILTGTPAGEPGADGSYPAGTVNALVSQKLKEYTDTLIKLSKSSEDKND
ncbi:Lon protease family protein [Sporomusa sphaeroides]|uniref:endopeptidase La n=1 Tax=Sporomusa sphaeroides DSM 2875 TaxID=1337886 RepID=A0ABM9W2K3_9FIRM|nr:ATP-binding protein [Sporomusa sphaeroides]OLS55758.1 Lon protease [Sporomusa sphaeroides DSM 2875]CVK19316.1 Lon protease [Sporomusa sphaeroides DSM 2875]